MYRYPSLDRDAITDVVLVLLVCAAYVAAEALQVPKRWSYGVMAAALLAFVLYFRRCRPDTWRDLGFRADNLRGAGAAIGGVTLLFAAGLVVWARAVGRAPWAEQSTLLLALYPPWALVQQGVFQGVLHRRVASLSTSPWLPALVTALAFAAVHWGNPALVCLTLGAGVAWSLLYRSRPNVWLLAASHTILAALAYPAVLGDAPLSRF